MVISVKSYPDFKKIQQVLSGLIAIFYFDSGDFFTVWAFTNSGNVISGTLLGPTTDFLADYSSAKALCSPITVQS